MALRKIFVSAAALSAARIFQLGVSFLTVPFIARLLDPQDFGLVALGMATVSLTLAFSDAGLSRSLVRTSELDSDAWASAHWLIILVMAVISVILFALAWPASIFFRTPALMPVMMALALIPLMQGFLELPIASLIKRENMLPLAGAEFASAILGAAAAIGFALAGFGAWALVAQNITNILVRAPIILAASKFFPRPMIKLSALKEHMNFARDTLGYSLAMIVGKQIDPMVIGRVLGVAPLGLYTVAFRIMSLPAGVVATPLQTTLYPRLVKLRDKPVELKALVLAATMAQAALVFPAIAALAAASGPFFTILLSERWTAAAAVFSGLAVAGMVQVVTSFNGPLLQAIGRTGARLRLTVESTILWAITVPIIAQFGVVAVAIGFSVVSVIYLPRMLWLSLRPIGCSLLEYGEAIFAPVVVSAAIVGGHLTLQHFMPMQNWEQLGLIVVETLVGYAALVVVGRRKLMERLDLVRTIIVAG